MSNIHDRNVTGTHIPVMLKEVLQYIAPKDGCRYLDCTFGNGGHSRAILQSANCTLIALDRDKDARKRAELFKEEFQDRFEFFDKNFSQLDKTNTNGYSGVLMDLGVSSFQLDEAHRGFSFMRNGPLDMRMDRSHGATALELINSLDSFELARVIREYGEEPKARKIAEALKLAAKEDKIPTTESLAQLIKEIAGDKTFGKKIHPATKTFQALRIAVNNELGEIEEALPKAFDRLCKGGVLVVISFHSLEDRIVKKYFKHLAGRPIDSHDRSFLQDRVKRATILTTKVVTATEEEIKMNPRSRSAKLRAIMKD